MTVLEEKPDDPCHAPILASNIANLRGYDEVAAGQPEATVRGAALRMFRFDYLVNVRTISPPVSRSRWTR